MRLREYARFEDIQHECACFSSRTRHAKKQHDFPLALFIGRRTIDLMSTTETKGAALIAYAEYTFIVVLPGQEQLTVKMTFEGNSDEAHQFLQWLERLERHHLLSFSSMRKEPIR